MIRDKDIFKVIVNRIRQSAADVKENEPNEFTEGQLEAYTEVINILKDVAIGENIADLGLNFNPDRDF